MREVLLVRHGAAEANAVGGDAARALTADGREGVAAVARGLAALGRVAQLVLVGPHGAALIGLWSAELLARVR